MISAAIALSALVMCLFFARRQRRQATLLERALNNMSQGVNMFDAHSRIVLCNRRYIAMYALSDKIVKPGCSLRELIQHRK
jgi:PAS domain-containing protein